MKKALVPGLLFSLILLVACSSTQAAQPLIGGYVPKTPDAVSNIAPEPVSGKTAFEYFRDEGLAVGWNLGNTLDAWNASDSGEDVGWGNPRANQAIFDGVKEAGYDLVRIPVTWKGHIGPAPDYRIRESYLRRVAEVVAHAKNAGFRAVIINLHHDGSTESGGRDNGWLSINTARKDEAGYNKVTFEFVRVWQQIAAYFKNHGDYLMFESFNELHDGGWGWSDENQQRPQYAIINEWNQFFTNAVRDSGGNNDKRFLIIQGYSAAAKHTIANYFVLPADSVPGRQIVSFHYYDPYEFGILGDQRGGFSEWGSDSDKEKVDKDFAPFKAKFTGNSIPVIIGESGAVRQLYPADRAKEDRARLARLEYISHVYGKAKEYGLVPVYWDNGAVTGGGEKFGLFNRSNGKPNPDESYAVIDAMINSAKN